jgi:hypothetical protein
MARVHRGDGIVATKTEVHGIGEAGSVRIEGAAKAATAGHVELAIPGLERQADLEVDGGSHEAEHAAVGREITTRGHLNSGQQIGVLDLQVCQTGAILCCHS